MYKVTIGVPLYNSSKLIHNALDSFVEQTMDKKEFEVICVDDCSTDNTLEIINEYKNKLNLRIIQLDENSGGPSKPRNKVIEKAKGEFIFFVDSDDYISKNTLLNSYIFAKENDSDIVLVKMKGVNDRKVPKSMFEKTNQDVDLYDLQTSRLIYALNPLKLFKTNLLQLNNIFFPTDVHSAEDQLFVMKAYVSAEKISTLADQDYYYAIKHDGEHMSSAYTEPKAFYQIMIDIINYIYMKSNETNDRKDMLTANFINRHFNFSRTYNITIKNMEQNEKDRWFNFLHNFIKNHVPETVDKLVNDEVYIRLTLARKNDQINYKIHELKMDNNHLKRSINTLNKEKKDLLAKNNKLTNNNTYLTKTLNRKSIKATRKAADFISSLKK